MTNEAATIQIIGIYEFVVNHTDFLLDLPRYDGATDASVSNTVDTYIEVAEDIAEMSFGGIAKADARVSLTRRAWSVIERENDERIEENERAERPSRPEYSNYYGV